MLKKKKISKEMARLGTRGPPYVVLAFWYNHLTGADLHARGPPIWAGQPALADWTLHDLRRSVATALGDLEMAMPHVVETLLGHRHERVGSAHAIYNRSGYWREAGRALAAWAEHLMGLVDGRKPAAEVVVAFAGGQAS